MHKTVRITCFTKVFYVTAFSGSWAASCCIFVQEQCFRIETDPVDFQCKTALLAVRCCGPQNCPRSNHVAQGGQLLDSVFLLWAFLCKNCVSMTILDHVYYMLCHPFP